MFEEYEDEAEDYRVQPLNPADRYSGAVVLVVVLVCAWLLVGCDMPKSETRDTSFDVYVYTDKGTGCQYVSESRGLTPRIAADGKTHMGCKAAQ